MIEKSLLSVLVGAWPGAASALCFRALEAVRGSAQAADAVCWRLPGQLSRGCHLLASSHSAANFALHWLLFLPLHLCPLVGSGCACCLLHVDESCGTLCASLTTFPYFWFALIFYTFYGGKCISPAVIPYFFQATDGSNLIAGNKEEKYPILKTQDSRLTEANMAHAEGRGKSNVYLPFGMSCSDCR